MEPQLDQADRKILFELTTNARRPFSQIGKSTGLSEQLLNYRVNRLMSKGFISRYVPIVNIDRMGLGLYRAMFRMEGTTKEKMNKIKPGIGKRIFQQGSTIGSWDLSANFACRSAREFHDELKAIRESCNLSEYTTMTLTSSLHFNRRFFINGGQARQFRLYEGNPDPAGLDKKDISILRQLGTDARMSILSISKNTGIAHSTIKSRIKDMEKNKIIQGYCAFLHPTLFNVIRKKVLIRSYNQLETERLLYDFALKNPHVYVIEKMDGRWDFELLLEAFDYSEFHGLIRDLRSALSSIRFDYELIDIAYNHDFNFNALFG